MVFCRAYLTAVWGVGHQEESFFQVGRIVQGGRNSGRGDLPTPFHISPSMATCPHIPGQQLDNH